MASSLFLSPLGSRSVRELLLLAALAALFVAPPVRGFGAETPTTAIKVDQVGYPLNGPKVALVSAMGKSFELKRSSDGVVVFRGNLTAPQPDVDTGDQMQAAEFSGFSKPGTYYLDVAGVGRSWNFTLGSNVYERPYYMAMRGFYGQRCGTAVDMGPEFPGFSHPACHLHGEFHPSSGKAGERNNVGGWHDAGDYGRYEVNSSISTGTLLWAWEIYGPRLKNIQLKIPETGNRTPDILNEARWNLEWMLKMQDEDGGVWHKQTSAHFSGFIAPQDDTLPSVVIGTGAAPYKSTCATADLAAVAAIATVVATAPLFAAHVDVSQFASGADFATALRPLIGTTGATLFALGIIEAGLVAGATISTSSSYALAETISGRHSLNLDFANGWLFYGAAIVSMLVAAGIVLIPGAPLLAMTLTVNVIATLLMAPALLFLLLLVNDREIMRDLANGWRANVAGGTAVVAISIIGALYGVITVFPNLFGK